MGVPRKVPFGLGMLFAAVWIFGAKPGQVILCHMNQPYREGLSF
jgi:hypothetical protein